jgi:hypothetical protein
VIRARVTCIVLVSLLLLVRLAAADPLDNEKTAVDQLDGMSAGQLKTLIDSAKNGSPTAQTLLGIAFPKQRKPGFIDVQHRASDASRMNNSFRLTFHGLVAIPNATYARVFLKNRETSTGSFFSILSEIIASAFTFKVVFLNVMLDPCRTRR